MDNLGAYRRKEVGQLVEAQGCKLLYLPPYSPDFSPTELAFSKIKSHLKSLAARSKQALSDAVAHAIRTISSVDAAAWFRHCGYDLQ